MTKLSVNVNKVATLRNTRHSGIPSVVRAATICLEAGAHGITVHPRPDQRHIRPSDVYELAELLKSYPSSEFNIEGNPFHRGYLELVRAVVPSQCTLVPDAPDSFTSDQGWDLARDGNRLRPIVAELRQLGCRISLFLNALPERAKLAAEIGADRIELYTEPYATAFAEGRSSVILPYFSETARLATEAGLGVNAGHDLNRANLPTFLKNVPGVLEVSIGHALIADALEMGYAETVKKFLEVINA